MTWIWLTHFEKRGLLGLGVEGVEVSTRKETHSYVSIVILCAMADFHEPSPLYSPNKQWRLCYPPSLDESASLEVAVTSPVNELWKWLVSSSLGEGKHEHIGPSNKITLISIHQKTVKLDSQILRIERTGVSKGYKSRQCVLYSNLLWIMQLQND